MYGRKLNTTDQDIWITSDLHFFHKGILGFCAETRPFEDVNDMIVKLMAEWNSKVKENDIIFHLGDFSFRGKEATQKLLNGLNGNIVFIYGNHDKVLRQSLDVDGYDYLEVRIDGHKVCMSHFPMLSWNQQGRGSLMLHGHCHGSLPEQEGRILDVGYDSLGEIKNIKEVLDLLLSKEIYSPDQHKVVKE